MLCGRRGAEVGFAGVVIGVSSSALLVVASVDLSLAEGSSVLGGVLVTCPEEVEKDSVRGGCVIS